MLGRLPSWWRRRHGLGARGERAAARLLRKSGYRILARNLRMSWGEIDIVAEDPQKTELLIIVEVKSGTNDEYAPEIHVNAAKRRKLASLARGLLKRKHFHGRRVRFDVVGVVWPKQNRKPTRITHHVGAFVA